MLDSRAITRDDYEHALKTTVELYDGLRNEEPYGRYFKEEVRRQLVERFGAERVAEGGLRVYTTIDLAMQPFGALRATTVTSGSPLDPDGYLLRVGGEGPGAGGVHYPIGSNEELVLPELRPGPLSLELVEVAENCAVAGENPRTVTVTARQETVSTFQVSCAP